MPSTKKQDIKTITRREFIARSAVLAGTTGTLLMPEVFAESNTKSKVVIVRHSGVVESSGQINQELLDQMFAKGMTALSGEDALGDAWKKYIMPNDRVGIKLNTIGLMNIKGTALTNHYSGVNQSIVKGLKEAGCKEENMILWDRFEEELENAGLTLQKSPEKVRVLGTMVNQKNENIGYNSTPQKVGAKTSRVTKIVTSMSDSMINVSLLKNHMLAGVTGCLKNHYGTIDNPNKFHGKGCTNPGVSEINMIPVIREKQKLCICDALLGVHSGGPFWKQKNIFTYGGLIFGVDPVAVDAVCLKIINEQREKLNKKPISSNKAKHIKLSEDIGLGQSKLDNIDLQEINLG